MFADDGTILEGGVECCMYYDGKKPDVMNWRLIEGAELVGEYGFPKLMPVIDAMPSHLVPFHHIGVEKNKGNSWFHFYVDDFRTERLWKNPEKYLPLLLQFAGGIGMDFSVFLDQPRGQQVGNAYRNYVLTYWLQVQAKKQGKVVIPNACFSDEKSLDWIFDPLPEKSVLAITTQGCMRNGICKQLLLNGLHELIRCKKPTKLIVYGLFPDEWRDKMPVEVITFDSFSRTRWVI